MMAPWTLPEPAADLRVCSLTGSLRVSARQVELLLAIGRVEQLVLAKKEVIAEAEQGMLWAVASVVLGVLVAQAVEVVVHLGFFAYGRALPGVALPVCAYPTALDVSQSRFAECAPVMQAPR